MIAWFASRSPVKRFRSADEGSMTIFGLFIFLSTVFLGGLVIDISRLQTMTVLMQNTADSAALAAMSSRVFNTTPIATASALSNADANMPRTVFGQAVLATDVEWGTWNEQTQIFTPSPTRTSAVRVTVRQVESRGNAFRNTVLRLLGFPTFDVARFAVASGRSRKCLREGFVSQSTIDIQSNNTFLPGFCIHSNAGVNISSGGVFTGTSVTMPNPALKSAGGGLQLPGSGLTSNVGLQEALGADQYELYTLTHMERIIESLRSSPSSSAFLPDYIKNTTPLYLASRQVRSGDLLRGRIYTAMDCASNEKITIRDSSIVQEVILITNCQVQFGPGVVWESSILASTNRDPDVAVVGASGMRLGVADGCAANGGSQILSLGGVNFSAAMTVYGGQILARGNVNFSASGNGVRGISIVAGGTLRGTSGMIMSSCNELGLERNILIPYVQLVQ